MKALSYWFFGMWILIGCSQKTGSVIGVLPELTLEKTNVKLEVDGRLFRDLNHNGKLDVYEDVTQSTSARVQDILAQMTLAEKAGMMFINGAEVNADGSIEKDPNAQGFGAMLPTAKEGIDNLKMTHFNIWQIPPDPAALAKWNNNLQLHAETTRLGIPITIASDPRHHFSENIFSIEATGFTQFCETPGLAALDDEALVEQFADVVRQEYLAVGIREALHPQIDLATEPRWPRISGGFSSDAHLTARMASAYIKGLQGPSLREGVACMTKHFPGGGPQKEGLDPHFEFQQGQIYPGKKFDYHLIPFEAAFAAGTAAIMPYYGIPTGQTDEDVAMAFNKTIITDLLRNQYEYDGLVCTDWGLITDITIGQTEWAARAWGVEHLSEAERVLKVIDAGVDQFGGESRPDLVLQLVDNGKLSEQRIDVSIKRLLEQKFELGLFDNPFVDVAEVPNIVGKKEFQEFGAKTQQQAMTLLKNQDNVLPLAQGELKVYLENMDEEIVAEYATLVENPEEADLAILRIKTPWYPVETDNFFARMFHHGDLDFKGEAKAKIMKVLKTVPTVVNIYLDRPAVIPDIAAEAQAVIADFGASDRSVCEVLFGNSQPQGKLPFELPSSMQAVKNQKTDVPYDSENPLFEFGFGLSYIDSER